MAVRLRCPETITFDGVWTRADRAGFEKVITAFSRVHPEIKVEYRAFGTNITTAVTKAVADGRSPDMADLPQPGFVKQLAQQGDLKPITYAKPIIARNFAPILQQLGTYKGRLYALVFKAANKSLLWYNVPAFRNARATPPKTWSQLLAAAKLLDASGVPAYSIGGAEAWTLTDLFENIYLRMYGPAKYDALSAHTIKWTDPSVSHALRTMAEVIGDRPSLTCGIVGALQHYSSDSVKNAFSKAPKAAIVFEGDFVARSSGTRETAQSVVFDMSDEQPASFGSTDGQGE